MATNSRRRLPETTGKSLSGSFQYTISFEPGLCDRYPALMDAVRARVAAVTRARKALAADMDLSESELSRKLAENDNDTRRFTVADLQALCDAEGPGVILEWMIARYSQTPEQLQANAAMQLAQLMPQILALAKVASAA